MGLKLTGFECRRWTNKMLHPIFTSYFINLSFVFSLFFSCCSYANAEDPQLTSVDKLLEKASKALQEKNYQGRFTYEFGTTLETLEIVHAVKDGVEYERVSHLNGQEREFIRSGRHSNCVSPGGFLLRGGLIPKTEGSVGLNQNYRFFIKGRDRIAGRDAEFIQIEPLDGHRYGMVIAVDSASGIPLMSLITAGENKAIERFLFTELAVDGAVSEKALLPITTGHSTLDGTKTPCTYASKPNAAWQTRWLPPGFVLSQVSVETQGETHTYTDGIASFTLFIQAASGAFKHGAVRRGASLAYISPMSAEQQVVLVGEIPLGTAQQIVASLTVQQAP
jgi:sigma-E factor negative regulatory protein RseB